MSNFIDGDASANLHGKYSNDYSVKFVTHTYVILYGTRWNFVGIFININILLSYNLSAV